MTTFERLTGIFRNVFDDETLELRGDMTANDVEGWDSFAHVNLITAIELAFDVTLSDAEVLKLTNVDSILALVEAKTDGRP